MNDVESRLRASFARQTMMQTLGATMEEAAEGRVTIARQGADRAPVPGQGRAGLDGAGRAA